MSGEKLKLEVLLAAIDKVTRPLKAITAGSTETARALKAAKDQLKQLNDAQGRIDAFRKVSKDSAITANQLKAAQQRLREVKQAMSETLTPSRELKKAFADARQEVSLYGMRLTTLIDKKKRLRGELEAAGVPLKDLKRHQGDLAKQIDAATAAVKRQTEAMQKQNAVAHRMYAARAQYDKTMAARNKLAGAGVSTMAAGAAIGLPLLKTVKEFAVAEDAATQLKVAMMGSGGKVAAEFERINDLASRLGNRLPGTTAEYQDMMTMLIRQGMSAKAILGGLGEATAYLAVQLKLPQVEAAEFASKLQDATRTVEGDMMGLMDVIQRTFYLGVDHNNMLQGFAKLSPALSILKTEGLAAAKALAPLLVMTDQAGMAGESAGNAFRKIFQLSMDAKKVAKGNAELSGTGIRLDFTNGKGEFGGLDQMYQQLAKLKGVNTQQRLAALKKIFGDDAETLQALTIMIEKGVAGYREVQAKMEAQADLQRRVNEQLGTLKNLWEAASGTFTNAMVAWGEAISPEMKTITEWINKLSEGLQAWAKEHPEIANIIMKTTGVLAVLLTTFGALGVGLAGVMGTMAIARYGFFMAGGAIKTFGVALRVLAMNPFVLVILGIALAALLIYKYWEPIKAFFASVWEGAKENFHKFIDAFKNFEWSTIGQFIVHGIETGLDALTGGLYSKLKALAGGLVTVVKDALGIKSPSRVFAEIGGFTMEGLEQGLLGGQGGPLGAVRDMARRMAAAGAGVMIGGAAMAGELPRIDTRAALSTMGAMASGGGAPMIVNITINAAPGMNETAIARQVAAELQRIEASRAARGRSRLRDSE